MKTLLLLLFFSLQAGAQSVDAAKFKEVETHAPKGYPTLFMVKWSAMAPASLGQSQECSMELETLGNIYRVDVPNGIVTPCKALTPGTPLWGRVHNNFVGQVIDAIESSDASVAKPKSRRYFVRSVQLVDPATQ